LFAAGGSVIDSSPMYGRAEATTGELLAAAIARGKAFRRQQGVDARPASEGLTANGRASLRLLRAGPLDLMQVHNLLDWRIAPGDAARLEGGGAHPLFRHHPLQRQRL
jgi:diketogulonate reductase-like aldo/keto reductase